MGITVLGRKIVIRKKETTAVAPLALDYNMGTIFAALGIELSWWTLDKIFIVTPEDYTGTFTFTVDVNDTVNEIDRAKISSAIAAENQIEISDLGLDGRLLDHLKIVSSADLIVGSIFLYMTFILGI